MRWNTPADWVWSTEVVHEPLVDLDTFDRVQDLLAAAGRRAVDRKPRRSPRRYVLRVWMYCGLCQRRMQGSWRNDKPHYRCVFPEQYALANKVHHPRSVYVREELIVPALDGWLAIAFSPSRLRSTVRALEQAQDVDDGQALAAEAARRTVAECDDKLARYRAALESGTDPDLIARWTAEVTAQKVTAQAKLRAAEGRRRMTEDEITGLVTALGSVLDVLHDADPTDKAEIYQRLGLHLTYQPGQKAVIAEAKPSAIMYQMKCPRGHTNHFPTAGVLTTEFLIGPG